MKQFNRILWIFLFLSWIPSSASMNNVYADESMDHDIEDDMLDHLSLNSIESHWNDLINNYGGYIPELEKANLIDMIKDQGQISIQNIMTGIIIYIFYELFLNGQLLGLLIMLTLFSTILQMMHHAFDKSSISTIAYFVVYSVLIYIAINSFFVAYSYAQDAIHTMGNIMIALIPLLLGMMSSFGNLLSVSFFHPIIIFLVHLSSLLIGKLILPLLFLSAILYIVSHLNEKYQVTHLAKLFQTISMGILGGFLTIFLGVMSVQGVASAIQDGVALKTAKFITGNFIPIVGRTFTEATDTILTATLILKNGIGIVGVMIIIIVALFPSLKIFVIALIYKLAAAILQPLGDGPIISCLHTISKSVLYILACVLVMTLMFFLAIVIMIIATNVTLFLR